MEQDKLPIFILVDRSTEQRYLVPAKSGDGSTIQILLAGRQQEPLTVHTDGFCAYDPLDESERFDREYVVHGDGEYANDTVQINTCESRIEASQKIATPYLRDFCSVESAEGVGIGSPCTRFRTAAERIQRCNLSREGENRDHWVEGSNSSTKKRG
jgi:transposase-like protein